MDRSSLRSVFSPRSVAVVGASDDPDKVGGRPVDYLKRFRFGGAVYPVNPHRSTVQGLDAYPTLSALPEVPEVALVVVPGAGALRAVEEAAEMGTQAAIVLASGFGETSEDGRRLQEGMTAVAGRAGMRVMGPNCQGVANFSNGAVLTFSTMYLEEPPEDGPVAVISQSGSMSQVPYAFLRARGIGVRYCAATGNEADISAAELAAAVVRDPDVRVVLLYLETIRETRWLAELGRAAAERDLPVVALKAGATAAGQAAARSHTGGLANEDRVVDVFLERAGIHRAIDLPDLVRAVDLHLRGDWGPAGHRVAIVSNSGASCVQAADAVVTRGMRLADLGAVTVERIASVLPAFATSTNPVDMTGALLGNGRMLEEVLPILGADPGVDSLVIALPVLGQGYDVDSFAGASAAFADSGRPTVVVTAHPAMSGRFAAKGLPVFQTEAEAVAALAQWTEATDRSAAAASRPLDAQVQAQKTAHEPEILDEVASLAVLAEVGVRVVDHELCRDAATAVEAWKRIGSPVAVKGCTRLVAHKSDAGLVALDLRSEKEVTDAWSRISGALATVDPDPEGVVVARMVSGRRELMIGGRIDPVFGAVVVIGDGGSYVEVLPDVQVLLAPVHPDDVRRALARLRIAPLAAGVRGEPPWDVDSFVHTVIAVSDLLVSGSGVVELDINPVLVGAVGEGCIAVDASVARCTTR